MLNNVTLVGNLVRDVEIKTTQSGSNYVNFTIAVDRSYKDKNGDRPTDFIRCVAWNGSAEFLNNYASKGDRISVQGDLRIDNAERDCDNCRNSMNVNYAKVNAQNVSIESYNNNNSNNNGSNNNGSNSTNNNGGNNNDNQQPQGQPQTDDYDVPF